MSAGPFNESFVSPQVAPACGQSGASEFPMEETICALDGETMPDDTTDLSPGEAFKRLLMWARSSVLARKDERVVGYIGKRTLAALWVMMPESFNAAPAHEVAIGYGISPINFSRECAEFSRQFGIRNQFQAHDAKNKPHRLVNQKDLHGEPPNN